ncbi:MAG: MFS transporter [archaeon]
MHHHKHFLNFLLNRELNGLYLTVAMKAFTYSMIAIFIPLFLLNLGYVFQDVIVFYLISFSIFLVLTLITPKIINLVGLKRTMLISIPLFSLAYFLLSQLNGGFNWLFYSVPVIQGIAYAFFWIPFHSDFAISSSKKKRATQTGIQHVLISLLAALGPIVGGFLLIEIGFHWLLISASCLMFLGMIPLLRSGDFKESKPGKIKDIFKYLDIRNFLGHSAFGVEWTVYAVVWPMFLILILKGYLLLGIIFAIPLIINLFSTIITASISDKKGAGKIMRIGSLFLFVSWFLRAFITKTWHVIVLSIYSGVIDPSTKIGLDSICYNRAGKKHPVESIAGREFAISFGRLIILILLFIWPSFTFAFIFAAFSVLLYIVFSLKHKKDVQKVWLFRLKK